MSNPNNDVYIISSDIKDLILVFKEAKKTSLSQSTMYFNKVKTIVGKKPFHYIVDISETEIPCVEVRNYIKYELQKLDAQIISYNIFLGNNFLQKIALKFIGASTGLKNHKSFDSIQDAILYIEKKYRI